MLALSALTVLALQYQRGLALDAHELAQEKLLDAVEGKGEPYHHPSPLKLDVSDASAEM